MANNRFIYLLLGSFSKRTLTYQKFKCRKNHLHLAGNQRLLCEIGRVKTGIFPFFNLKP